MRFINPILFTRNIEASKQFYSVVLGLKIAEDHGNFVRFIGGFAIHDGAALEKTIWGHSSVKPAYGHRDVLFYFEVDDLDAMFERIKPRIELIHPIATQSWGQRVFRFLDPDGHTIEIGEPQHTNN